MKVERECTTTIFKLPRRLSSSNNLIKHLTAHINYEGSLVMKFRGKVKDSNELGMHFFTIVQQALMTYWPTQV